MNLGDELRAVLNQEADMQVTQGPDVDRLIMGGRARRRRRNLTRAGSPPSPSCSSAAAPTR